MTSTNTDEIHTDEAAMAICAIRYCIGRMSYITSDGQRWARKYGRQSRHVRKVIIRDLQEAAETADRMRASGSEYSPLGMEMDERGWREVLAELKAMDASA
ncbi:MAG: hypothetical protein AB7F35_00955 [Acetobacteraceae bacterium]